MDTRFKTIDLHCHPSMMTYMLGTKFWKKQNPTDYGFCPWAMRVNIDELLAGEVKAFLCTAYVLERIMFKDAWPLGLLSQVHPRLRRIATTPLDQLLREYLDTAEQMVEETRQKRGDIIEVGRSYADYQRITGENKICMLHAVEGAHHLNGNIDMVDELYERGVCQMIVPHLYPNEAGGCTDLITREVRTPLLPGCFKDKNQDTSGISDWGRELVEKLLDVGILVDPTHGTREYRRQIIEIARNHPKKRPVIMSHVNLPGGIEAKGDHDPLPEDIREIADTGGAIGIIMSYHEWDNTHAMTGVENIIACIDHLIQHGGEDVVAFGSDFDGYFKMLPKDIKTPRGYSAIREAIMKKYSEDQVAKFMSGNAERVLQEGWGK